MDQVLARIKRLRKNPYKKVLSDTTLYPTLDLGSMSTVAYSADHNLDEDAWFKIDEFSKTSFFLEELSDGIDAKDYDDLAKERFADISFLMCAQGEDVYFQKITPSSHIKRKMIQFGEAAQLVESADRIVVKATPDAVFVRSKDILIFRDLATISSIFSGIDQLYKEATEAEVKAFLGSDFIEVEGAYNHESVSKPNRRRLALVADTLKSMSEPQRASLIEYVKDYCKEGVTVTEDGKHFVVSTDVHLKFILYGIEERFYTTQHGREKRLANSVEAMG